jgi:glycolate oxidase
MPVAGGVGADGRGHPQFVAELKTLLAPGTLLADPEETRPYECDALTLHRRLPMLVALPADEQQLIAVLRCCHRWQVPVVPRGAGTGLSGGAMPHSEGVLVSLARFDRILKVDPETQTAVVQPGVRNLAISEAAAPHGLFYAPDPSSQVACTIGGNVAENAGGVHCLKYGLTLHNVQRLRTVTMEGEVLECGSAALEPPGLDLRSLLVGSEGMLAVVTEVTVKLLPRPPQARCIIASFSDVQHAGDAVAAVISAGIIPAGMEMLDRAAIRLVERYANAGYDTEAAAVLLCESDGTAEEVAEEIARVSAVLSASGATRVQVSRDETERQRFWHGRKSAFPAAGRAAPAYYCMDGTIPRKHVGAALRAIQEMESEYGLDCLNVFHAGDGNLHPLILFDDADTDSVRRAESFGAAILERCIALGGTISGEHGIGVEKLNQMCSQFDQATREVFEGVKRAFDPSGLLNPGKVIPTLHRCAEYGLQRVHGGALPFPGLPRF